MLTSHETSCVSLLPGPHDDAVTDTIREGWNTLSHSSVSLVLCFNCSPWWCSGLSFLYKNAIQKLKSSFLVALHVLSFSLLGDLWQRAKQGLTMLLVALSTLLVA